MYSHEEIKSMLGFIKTTGEGNLKKMLVGGRMSEAHLRMLLKVARACKEEEFIVHMEADSFPKTKYTPPEIAMKEGFWAICAEGCAKVGLLSPTAAKKAA